MAQPGDWVRSLDKKVSGSFEYKDGTFTWSISDLDFFAFAAGPELLVHVRSSPEGSVSDQLRGFPFVTAAVIKSYSSRSGRPCIDPKGGMSNPDFCLGSVHCKRVHVS